METEQQPKAPNTPSPLVPQGALPDSRGRSHIRIAVFSILAVHAVLLGTLLIFGCKKAPEQTADQNVPADLTNNSAFPTPPPQMAFTPQQFPEPTATSIPPLPATTTPTAVPEPALHQPVTTTQPQQSTAMPSSDVREHVVVKGESFYTIAKKYNSTMRAIAQANAGVDANRLKIGQKLVVPPPQASSGTLMADAGNPAANGERMHTVKTGDNLTTIARRNGVSVKDIQAVNNLRTTQIRVGQKLRLPERSNAPAQSLDAIPPLTPASSTAGSTAVPVLPQ